MKFSKIVSVVAFIVLCLLGSAAAADHTASAPNYLALGDSVAFGFIDQAGYEWYYPTNFVAYGDYAGLSLGLNLANASCPGETTSSFLSIAAPDNGCHLYRMHFPLHVVYTSALSTQFTFAKAFLRQHSNTALVTVQLGADDLLLLEQQCAGDPTCIAAGAPQVFATAAANMQTILAGIRGTGYSGTLVIVNYYSPDYSNQFDTELIEGLNQAITAPAQAYGAVVADVFSAFQAAVSNPFAQGNTCVGGLLNAANPQTDPPTCDVHPSQYGHKLIAQVVAGVYQDSSAKGGK